MSDAVHPEAGIPDEVAHRLVDLRPALHDQGHHVEVIHAEDVPDSGPVIERLVERLEHGGLDDIGLAVDLAPPD